MRIVIVSDTHCLHEQLGVLSGDVLIHCGDFCDGFHPNDSDVDAMDEWFGRQEFELIVAIGGNHDIAAQDREEHGEDVFENVVYLTDDSIEVGGLNFYGAPWIPRLQGWGYYKSDPELREKWELIPDDTDVLITHTPPFGILDKPRTTDSQGCPHLRHRVDALAQLKLHCFGHIHASYGVQDVSPELTFCNAALQRGDELKQPLVIEL